MNCPKCYSIKRTCISAPSEIALVESPERIFKCDDCDFEGTAELFVLPAEALTDEAGQ